MPMKSPSYTLTWKNLQWWVNFYSYLTFAVIIYGLVAAHVPFILGHPWTTCEEGGLGCVMTMHLFDGSMTLFNGLLVWYGLWKFSPIRVRSYLALLLSGVAVNLVFFSFECHLIFDSFDRTAPTWEIVALYSLAALLLGGVVLSLYVIGKLVLYLQYQQQQYIDGLSLGIDGYYHPRTEEEIVTLVKQAYADGLQVRCRGAAHSVAQAIYTNAGQGSPPVPNKVSEQTPPNGPNINISLDRFKKMDWVDEENGIVEAEAGINLGANPGYSTLEESFLYKIWNKGWALEDLGGITHQTISGFMMTGSAGGTTTYDLINNIEAFRVVDGRGEVQWIEKDKDPEFYALGSSLGVLGIITKIRFKLSKRYYIKGQEKTTPTRLEKCQIDLFGEGRADKPSLEDFFKQTPYTRIMWWPQVGSNRIVTWSAERMYEQPQKLEPYHEFSANGFVTNLEELAAAMLYSILGVKGLMPALANIYRDFARFFAVQQSEWALKVGNVIAGIAAFLVTLVIGVLLFIPLVFLIIFKSLTKKLLPAIINLIQPLTSDKNPLKTFQDYYYRSLPMDNVVDDIMMGTEFTEIWIPIQYTQQVMNLLKQHYIKNGYAATGAFSNELYAGHPTSYWMHQGYTNGADEFKEGTIRVDLFWYTANTGAPNGRGEYYDQFWKLFRENNIPFRLHWGKFIPDYDFPDWANYYQQQLPKMKEFLALREQRDPKDVFLTDYWKLRLYGSLNYTKIATTNPEQKDIARVN